MVLVIPKHTSLDVRLQEEAFSFFDFVFVEDRVEDIKIVDFTMSSGDFILVWSRTLEVTGTFLQEINDGVSDHLSVQ